MIDSPAPAFCLSNLIISPIHMLVLFQDKLQCTFCGSLLEEDVRSREVIQVLFNKITTCKFSCKSH